MLEEAPGADGDEADARDQLERHHFQIARALAADEDRDPGRDHERRGGRKEDQDRVRGAVAGEQQDGEESGELEPVGGSLDGSFTGRCSNA